VIPWWVGLILFAVGVLFGVFLIALTAANGD
jgi:hypothetical protein